MKQLVFLLIFAAFAAAVICSGSAIIKQIDWSTEAEFLAALRFP